MDYKKLGLGLGVFSIGLGLVEIAAPGRLARWLGAGGKTSRSRNGAIAGTLGFVAGAAIVDAIAARGLARETGRTFPRQKRLAAA